MTYFHKIFVILNLLFQVSIIDGSVSSATLRSRLTYALPDDTRVRPMADQAETVDVTSRFIPHTLLEFDTSIQKFSILGDFEISWKDEIIKTGMRSSYQLPLTDLWSPSLIIMKTFDGSGAVGSRKTENVTVQTDYTIKWTTTTAVSVVCDVDIKYFPFDEQTCTMIFYISDETMETVALDCEQVNLDEYTENAEWRMTSVTSRRYPKYGTYYVDIDFNLQRRPSFTIYTLIMPLLMLSFLSICMFLVPIGSGEKGSFAITIFLSYGIFVTIVSDTLPNNSLQVSYLLLFIILLLFMSVLAVFYTIIQSKIVAKMGDNECSIKLFRPTCCSKKTENETDETKSPKSDKDESEEESYTWHVFLAQLDMLLFLVFLILNVVVAVIFFFLMKNIM